MRLAEKLTKVYNAHGAASTMTLANVGTEVKQFWRDIKETRDLMYNGTNKAGGNNNASGQGQTERNKSRRQRKKDKKKAAGTEIIAQVTTSTEKKKDKYCFRCGDTSHKVMECTKQGDLKCKIDPNSKSHKELACFYYRKANNLPVRPCPEGPKDTPGSGSAPLSGNGSQNLVFAKIDNEVDTTDIYTDDE